MFPRLRALAPQLLLLDGVQLRGCSTNTSSSGVPPTSSGEVAAPSTAALSNSQPKNDSQLAQRGMDWTPGAPYYFSPEEEERFMGRVAQRAVLNRSRSAKAKGGGTASTDAGDAQPSALVEIGGPLQRYVVNTAIAPIRREEAERWRLEWSMFFKGISVKRRIGSFRPNTLLPTSAMVTYLGDDMHKIDRLYRKSGLYTPSEVAEALFPFVPTFLVETRHVVAAMPEQMLRAVEKDWGAGKLNIVLFARFPFLFQFRQGRYSKSFVALNSNFWFVRQHPSYGKADGMMRKFRYHGPQEINKPEVATLASGAQAIALSQEHVLSGLDAASSKKEATTSGASLTAPSANLAPLSVRLFHALVRNLPRIPTPPAEASGDATYQATKARPYVQERYRAFNLVEWVNSFPPDDAKLLGSVHEREVVRVLCEYPRVFQLVGISASDASIFVEGKVLLADREKRKAAGGVVRTLNGTDSHGRGDMGDADDQNASVDGRDSDDDLLHQPTPQQRSEEGTAATDNAQRTAAFQRAIADELIDVEGILTGPPNESLASQGEAASVAHEVSDAATEAGREAEEQDGEEDVPLHGFSWDREDGEVPQGDAYHRKSEFLADEAHHSNTVDDRYSADRQGASLSGREYRGPLPQGASVDTPTAFGLPLEEIYVRRLPPDVAPRSLSDWDETTSPDVELAALAARFLAPPPSPARGTKFNNFFVSSARKYNCLSPPLTIWRWVSVDRLYNGYKVDQRRYLRREYKGLVNFLRYHGKLFELSNDLMYVIAHDAEGAVAPIPFMERRFKVSDRVVLPPSFDDNDQQTAFMIGENDRAIFERVIGDSCVPTCRRHLLLLDPNNPILHADVLQEEIANLLPNHSVRLTFVLQRLPPLLRAAMPHRINFRASKCVDIVTERGVNMIRRKSGLASLNPPTSGPNSMSVEEAIGEVLELPIGPDGVSMVALRLMHLSEAAVNTLCDHYGTLSCALESFPQYFLLEQREYRGRKLIFIRFRT